MAHDVFISYSRKDISIAEAVCERLEDSSINCWMTPRDVTTSTSWEEAIFNAIESSKLMVLVLSSHSNNSPQVVREVCSAVGQGVSVIPFRIEDMPPSGAMNYFLSTVRWFDALTPPLEDHLDKLAETIHRRLDIITQAVHEPVVCDQDVADSTSLENTSVFLGQRQRDVLSKDMYVDQDVDDSHVNQLRVVDSLEVQGPSSQGQIQLCIGDLTRTGPNDSVDVLVVWTVRDSYFPIPRSLIGALLQRGISVEALAEDKEVDLRQAFTCWLSREIIDPPEGIRFKRILCYEPAESATAAEHVGDIFRSLAPFLGGAFPVRRVATPLLASGTQRVAAEEMLRELVGSAVHWLSSGLPIDCLKIVCLPDNHEDELTRLFSELKSQYSDMSAHKYSQFSYDFFISYSHQDVREVQIFEQTLLSHQKNLRIFIDRKNLTAGAAWQREIFESIDVSRKVAVFYSPTYLDSKVCIEEFNIALCRHRESDEPVLIPIYLYSAKLPTYMRLVQFLDCREFDQNKLNEAALEFVRNINK